MKRLIWFADTRSHVGFFPDTVQYSLGFGLYLVQLGESPANSKPLHGVGGGVMEISAFDASGTYRAVYTVSLGDAIYVVHAFQKNSKTGIATPKRDMELIRQRLKQSRSEVKNAEKSGS